VLGGLGLGTIGWLALSTVRRLVLGWHARGLRWLHLWQRGSVRTVSVTSLTGSSLTAGLRHSDGNALEQTKGGSGWFVIAG